eukprot:7387445-Prymnesium_polylepis.1
MWSEVASARSSGTSDVASWWASIKSSQVRVAPITALSCGSARSTIASATWSMVATASARRRSLRQSPKAS